jgi:AraC-like DNA-binding protein
MGVRFELPLHLKLGPYREHVTARLNEVIRLNGRGRHDALARASASAALLGLLLWLAELDRRGHTATSARATLAVEAAADFIERHLDSQLEVPQIAAQVGLSQNYLARVFRARFGETLPRHALERRVAAARHLLSTTTLSVKEIAARVGMPDAQHFNKQFRRLVGASPSQFRAGAEHAKTPAPRERR